ncbi:MAG: hypothetical protein GY708_00565 [Actinomycetia bacterium]|nr:hypothetical protein [Actinomycetes bacterium]
MTISKDSGWGGPGTISADDPVANNNRELRALIEAWKLTDLPLERVGLLGGDLWRTCGSPPGGVERLLTEALEVPIDIVEARLVGFEPLDGPPVEGVHTTWFAAHMVLRRSWWFGPLLAAMNAEFYDTWDVGGRTHPNDGRVDVYDVSMRLSERWQAWKRLPSGQHEPHPRIEVRRVKQTSLEFERPLDVHLDGDEVGRATGVELVVLPDALTVVV